MSSAGIAAGRMFAWAVREPGRAGGRDGGEVGRTPRSWRDRAGRDLFHGPATGEGARTVAHGPRPT
ncbi:hypothetical protein [Streptomyces sp. NPDC048710]|uniref:hypothetical protein n=1 Tax=unclassified Streptomyces TaxID=2593676 RepID=UPI003717EAD6